jgi:glyoxylase-like metal-dependent hydrolase (beta-lactamase superfamily II)
VKRANCLILSHTHPDHASGAWIFNEASKAVLAPMNFPTDIDSLAVRFVTEKFAETWKQFVTSPLVGMKSFKADKYNEGIISTEPEIEAIFAPGHSVDHHVFLINGKILFGSDIDLTSFGPWYGNPESDPWLFKKSIEMLLNLDFDVFISAHDNPVFGRDEIERRVINFLSFSRREMKDF